MTTVNRGSVIRVTTAFAAVVLLAGLAPTAGTAARGPAAVWFLGAEGPVAVERAPGTLAGVARRLLAGPTASELRRGLRTAIPPGTTLLGIESKRRVVTIDLGTRFAAGRSASSLRARAGQVIRTLRSVPGVAAVRITIAGGTPVGLFPGYDLTRPVKTALGEPANEPPGTRDLQGLLADLGYLARGAVSGEVDSAMSDAVLAFQKYIGLPRTGVLDETTASALLRAVRPEPLTRAPGRRIEVHLQRQVALLIDANRALRTVHVSTGAGGATPIGAFSVYRKEQYSWSIPFKVWLPWASYFTGGIAFHEYGSVPTYAASHGCIRVNHHDAQMLYGFAEYGTPVHVLWEAA